MRDEKFRRNMIKLIVYVAMLGAVIVLARYASAHDDGRFASSPLKAWFDKLASKKGLCCSFADGVTVEDVDWQTTPDGKSYEVRICTALKPDETWKDCAAKGWVVVPDAALITEPNKFGRAVVWPYQDATGATQIRCFIPGTGA